MHVGPQNLRFMASSHRHHDSLPVREGISHKAEMFKSGLASVVFARRDLVSFHVLQGLGFHVALLQDACGFRTWGTPFST